MSRPAPVRTVPIKLPISVVSSAETAAKLQGLTVEAWVQRAVTNELAQDRGAFKADHYWHLRRQAERDGSKPMPIAHEHGLPETFDTSSPPVAPSPFIKFRP